jgi:hypothetical protein
MRLLGRAVDRDVALTPDAWETHFEKRPPKLIASRRYIRTVGQDEEFHGRHRHHF